MIRVFVIVAACAICGPAFGQAGAKPTPEPEEEESQAAPAEAVALPAEAGGAGSETAPAASGAKTSRTVQGDAATVQIYHTQYFPEDTLVGDCRLNRDLCVQRAADEFCEQKGFTQSMGYNMERRTRSVGVSWHAQFISCVLFMRPRVPDPRLQPEAEEQAAEGDGAAQ